MPKTACFALALWLGIVQLSQSAEPTPAESILRPVGLDRDLGVIQPLPNPLLTTPFAEPSQPATPAPVNGLDFIPRGDLTYLPRGDSNGFGITDVEALCEIRIPFKDEWPPLKISPGLASRFWNGPQSTSFRGPDLPATVYDFYTDFGWRPRPFEWLFIDMKFTLGMYSDLENLSHDAFRPRGHVLGMFCFSEKFQIVLGAVYTNRLLTTVVPAGGIRYVPSEDTEFRLIFPAPKISHRIAYWGTHKVRAYVSGEFGGGAWAIRRADGRDDIVDYSDLRAIAGIETEGPGGRSWHAEVGYVFDRHIDYQSEIPVQYRPGSTLMFRIGTSY